MAGSPGQAGNLDGTGSAARLSTPKGVAVAPDGAIWVVEHDSRGLRRLVLR